MNENEFSAAFDAEDAFASRMDYMMRRKKPHSTECKFTLSKYRFPF